MIEDETVAVIVVMFNSAGLISDLLRSLERGLRGVSWHLTLVDNASSDESVALARRLAPEARIVETGRNGGYAAGINAGVVAAAQHTAVLILNPDVRLGTDCVVRLLGALRTEGTGIAVPRLSDGRGVLIHSMRREPSLLRLLADTLVGGQRVGRVAALGEVIADDRVYDHPQVTDWAEGSTMLVSAECWRRCGQWDESFFLFSEETDFALRARDAGLVTRYVPSAHAVHLQGGSASNPALWALVATNRVRLFSRRHGRVHGAMFYLVLVAREASRALIGKRTGRAALAELIRLPRSHEIPGPATLARHRV